jgi:hypothetical protein
MSADTSTPRSRRAILASALGGLGAAMASRLIKPESARAAAGDPVLVDGAHDGVGTTTVTSTTTGTALAGVVNGGIGQGVRGSSMDGLGVWGESMSAADSTFTDPSRRTGVIGIAGDSTDSATNTDETGVYGYANTSAGSTGVWGDTVNGFGVAGTSGYVGVLAIATDFGLYAFGRVAVTGSGDVTETGVYGFAGAAAAPLPPAGVGVQATAGSTAQIALNVTGKAKFSRSGRTYVATGKYSRKVTMAGVTTASYIIATLQTRRTGVYVHAVVPATGYFVIYLNKAVTANTYVGYLVIN